MTDIEKLKALALAAPKIKTWQEHMPKPRIAYQCDMNCSPRSEGKDCGDCTPVRVYGDPVIARDAEIADLRADNERLRADPLYSTRRDAERFQRAIALEDSAESLYAAVLSHAPDVDAIRREFDADVEKEKA